MSSRVDKPGPDPDQGGDDARDALVERVDRGEQCPHCWLRYPFPLGYFDGHPYHCHRCGQTWTDWKLRGQEGHLESFE